MDEWKNFVTAQFLQSHWKVLPAELLGFIHNGLPVYRQTGILIDAAELLPEKTLLDITKELALRAARDLEARKSRSFITLGNIPSSFDPRDFKNTIITKTPSPSCPATTETLSDIHSEAKCVFEKLRKRKDKQTLTDLNTFLFKREETNQFAKLHRLQLIAETPHEHETTKQSPMSGESCVQGIKDYETFIGSLQISSVSDTEIKIRGGGKNAKTYCMKDLGFQKEKSQAWKAFITLLNSKDHRYLVGKARGAKRERKKSYDIRQKVLVEINKKFVSFFNNTYQLRLSEKFRVYELIPEKNEAPGTYRFKFKIESKSDADLERFNELQKEQLLQKIEEFSEKFKKLSARGTEGAEAEAEQIKGQLYSAVEIALKKEWLTQNRAAHYLNPQTDDLPPVQHLKKIKGVWKSDINDSSSDDYPIDQEESIQED
jgi:hypothetical protein